MIAPHPNHPNTVAIADRRSLFLMDAGPRYPNDRFSAVILLNVSRSKGEITYPFVQMNSLGMYGFGELSKVYMEAVIRRDPDVEDREISWSELPESCKKTLQHVLPEFIPDVSPVIHQPN
ncbi:hypothetical protein Atc_2133 [Acidithiobacillus caldus SM-1]|uniref:Uncharacterized protein n=1 Tax=Acidithiobacillus caldus (strain SM-1) TaxID=990288 RepID=F9ZRZ7_ACICS|nr:hypothetical protein [Acidithiobacillus caldus]AEK58781.1 hypothetical protein Atc_2133 [Acidithiobacillus caldus SM-1]